MHHREHGDSLWQTGDDHGRYLPSPHRSRTGRVPPRWATGCRGVISQSRCQRRCRGHALLALRLKGWLAFSYAKRAPLSSNHGTQEAMSQLSMSAFGRKRTCGFSAFGTWQARLSGPCAARVSEGRCWCPFGTGQRSRPTWVTGAGQRSRRDSRREPPANLEDISGTPQGSPRAATAGNRWPLRQGSPMRGG
jgi:hypothetical protein